MIRTQARSHDELACWVCDYGWVVIGVGLLLGLTFWMRGQRDQQETTASPLGSTPTAIPTSAPTVLATIASVQTAVPMPTMPVPTPTSNAPEYIIVVIPLNWSGSRTDFEVEANRQVEVLIEESGMRQYFRPITVMLQSTFDHADLSDPLLPLDIVEFAVNETTGDRFIGLTDADLLLGGDSDVAGWTTGNNGLGLVAEAGSISIVAHEMGHTFGLCDEYSFYHWSRQNNTYSGGCPNPFPTDCPQDQDSIDLCLNAWTEAGEKSIMGVAGTGTNFGFNSASLDHLHKFFAEMLSFSAP